MRRKLKGAALFVFIAAVYAQAVQVINARKIKDSLFPSVSTGGRLCTLDVPAVGCLVGDALD